jgi:hypothetical protein
MKKWLLILSAANVFSYTVTSTADTDTTGTLRNAFTTNATEIDMGIPADSTITAGSQYTVQAAEFHIWQTNGQTVQVSSESFPLFSLGGNSLEIQNYNTDRNTVLIGDVTGTGSIGFIQGIVQYGEIFSMTPPPAAGTVSPGTISASGFEVVASESSNTTFKNYGTITSSSVVILSATTDPSVIGTLENYGVISGSTISVNAGGVFEGDWNCPIC